MASENWPLARVEIRAVRTVVRQQVRDIERKAVHHAETPITEHRHAITRQVSLTKLGLLDLTASPSRHDDPTADFRNVLLVQDLTHTHEHVQEFHLTSARVTTHNRERRTLDTKVKRASKHTGSRTLVGRGHTIDDAIKHVLVNRDLQLLGSVVRPHGQDIQVRLNFHNVVQDQREVLARGNVEFHRATSRTVEAKQAVGVIRVDGDGRLRADFHTVALILNFAFVVRVADRSKDCAGVKLFNQLTGPNLRNKASGLQAVTRRASRIDRRRGARSCARKCA